MKRYKQILRKIETLQTKLQDTALSSLERSLIEISIRNLVDEAHRMTFHISCVEEDNYI